MQDHPTFAFRAPPAVMERIEALAAERGCSKSAAVKQAVVEASVAVEGAPPILDEREVLRLLSMAARGGSVSAMKELLAYHRERRQQAPFDPLRDLDELSRRRGSTTRGQSND